MFDAVPFLAQCHSIGVYSKHPFCMFFVDVLNIDKKLETVWQINEWFYEIVITPLV